jgi:hypothetical protein
MAYVFRMGEAKACCDRCGFDFRLSQLKKEWTGKKVCRDCFETRHPQDFVRAVRDRQIVRDPRPEPADVFQPDFFLLENNELLLLEQASPESVGLDALALEYTG